MSSAIGMDIANEKVPHGEAARALTTTSASTANRMIMMVKTASSAAAPPTGPISSRAICPRLLPSRRMEKNSVTMSCTAPAKITPAERLENDIDFQPTDRRVLFGHHFAAIAGAGPLVGPVLAAQMGYLPGTIWIVAGVIFAGAVQDMVTLFFSMRRDGKSLGQMAREEIGPVGGAAALLAVFTIMIILLAVLALVVVNALAASPWGTFSIAMTIPIALFMGFYLRVLRPGRVME